jgi:hypothetical protein
LFEYLKGDEEDTSEDNSRYDVFGLETAVEVPLFYGRCAVLVG